MTTQASRPTATTRGRRWRRCAGQLGFAPLLLLAAGCFEDPVVEKLELEMTADGGAIVRYTLTVSEDWSHEDKLEQRFDTLTRELLEGSTPWQDRFHRLESRRDGESWERRRGELSSYERWAEIEPSGWLAASDRSPGEQLGDLLADTPIQLRYDVVDDVAELSLVPGLSDRASAAEAARVERQLDAWAAVLSTYLRATEELWRYIAEHPDRARPVLSGTFEDLLELEGEVQLPAEEAERVERYSHAEDAVLELFRMPEGETSTLQERSRRVFDPFPARFVITPPEGSRLLDVVGFRVDAERRLVVPPLSLWDAFQQLAGRWIWPDPLLAKVHHATAHPDDPFPLDAFLDQEFSYSAAPNPREVSNRLRDGLQPAAVYRASWSMPAAR